MCSVCRGRQRTLDLEPMANSQLFTIVLIAMVAAIILFRLYTVLGRRTGNERPPQERLQRIGGAGKSANNERAPSLPDKTAEHSDTWFTQSDPVARGLFDIKLVDRSFEAEHFVGGARKAYEMIVIAFAHGDRATLRPLLSDDVYGAFEATIQDREAKKRKAEFTFVGLREAKIVAASIKNSVAEVTVSFAAQFISAIVQTDGAVIEGDPKMVRDVNDVWTFERDVRSDGPNWKLVATSGDAGEPKAG